MIGTELVLNQVIRLYYLVSVRFPTCLYRYGHTFLTTSKPPLRKQLGAHLGGNSKSIRQYTTAGLSRHGTSSTPYARQVGCGQFPRNVLSFARQHLCEQRIIEGWDLGCSPLPAIDRITMGKGCLNPWAQWGHVGCGPTTERAWESPRHRWRYLGCNRR